MKKRSDSSLTKLTEAAFKQAAEKVVKRAIDTGTPLILWIDGKVAEVDPRTYKLGGAKRKRGTKNP